MKLYYLRITWKVEWDGTSGPFHTAYYKTDDATIVQTQFLGGILNTLHDTQQVQIRIKHLTGWQWEAYTEEAQKKDQGVYVELFHANDEEKEKVNNKYYQGEEPKIE